jgi:Family of unknown function (DUF6464)
VIDFFEGTLFFCAQFYAESKLPDAGVAIALPSKSLRVIHTTKNRMEQETLPTEVILTHPSRSLGTVSLDWTPQPGAYLDLEGQTYAVLERRHRYHLKSGRYRLHKVALYVQRAQRPTEKSQIEGRWVLGDATCEFNARSEIVRCAVNPDGPCEGCRHYSKNQSKTG